MAPMKWVENSFHPSRPSDSEWPGRTHMDKSIGNNLILPRIEKNSQIILILCHLPLHTYDLTSDQ